MMTYSGALVSPDEGVPSIPDIALALSRVPRFGGHTRRWWSVLDHSLFVHQLAVSDRRDSDTRLAVLLHDAHEALTGDIPTVMKTDGERFVQRRLDERIMRAHYPGGFAQYNAQQLVKEYDRRALLAEARIVGPPKLGWIWASEFADLFGDVPSESDMTTLQHLLLTGTVGRVDLLAEGSAAENVRRYVSLVQSLQAGLTVDTLVGCE